MVYLLQAGINGVAIAALYKPIAENDVEKISIIVKTIKTFFQKIAIIYIFIVVVIAIIYPFFVIENFDWMFTSSLVFVMSTSAFINFLFFWPYSILLKANQKLGLLFICKIVSLSLSTIISVIAIKIGFEIRIVQLLSVIALSVNPLLTYVFATHDFQLIKTVKIDNGLIKQRWDNFGQEIAQFISLNTDLIILSIFSNIYEVSVYSVYAMVANGVYGIIRPFVEGIESVFGNMYAKNEYKNLENSLKLCESVVFTMSTIVLGIAAVMIVPFVKLYTTNVSDVNYEREVYAILVIISTLFRCLRMPYKAIVNAVGHFKQTKNGALIEMAINIGLSFLLVKNLGIIGVMIGTIFSMVFRTISFALYISKNVIKRNYFVFFRRVIFSLICIFLIIVSSKYFALDVCNNYRYWVFNAILTSLISIVYVAIFEITFYKDDAISLFRIIYKVLFKR
jgi:O-antigen/teichoic acid export membrane protein